MKRRIFDRYVHTLSTAYRNMGVDVSSHLPAYSHLAGCNAGELPRTLMPLIRGRLDLLPAASGNLLLAEPVMRDFYFHSQKVTIPLINAQGVEWYGKSNIYNYDFIVEDSLGLLADAKAIYDFGGHQGIWAVFYAIVVGSGGRVYTFEPSIINVEASALTFLINEIDWIVNVGAGIKASELAIGANSRGFSEAPAPFGSANPASKMLIDFDGHIPLVDLGDVSWDFADFLKMDIEGYEYDVVTANPWIFDIARHMHIEIHIPHLERRGLDYRDMLKLVPFDKFDVFNSQNLQVTPIDVDTPLSGFCSLMMRRRA